MCGNKIFSPLLKCIENLISFSFAANMNDLTSDRATVLLDSGL